MIRLLYFESEMESEKASLLRNLTWNVCSVQVQCFLDAVLFDSAGLWLNAVNGAAPGCL